MPYNSFLADLRSNPLLRRETHRQKFSLRLFKWLLGFLLIFGFGEILTAPSLRTTAHIEFGLAIIGAIAISIPLSVASSAVEITYQYIYSKNNELLYLTPLSNLDFLKGFILSALHRQRILLLLIMSLMPLGTISLIFLSTYEILYRCLYYSNIVNCILYPSTFSRVLASFVNSAFLTLSIGGLTVLAATIGVTSVLWWRNYALAKLTAIATTLFVTVLAILGVLSQYDYPLFSTVFHIFLGSFLTTLILAGLALPSVRKETSTT